MMIQHLIEQISLGELLKYLVELAVLFLILREIRELRKHHRALEKHEEQLREVRPLISTLYTDRDSIMDLAVTFTQQAKELYALGTITSLRETEMQPDEMEADFNKRLNLVDPKKKAYIQATREYVLSGRKYCRIMDFCPRDSSFDSVFELLSNLNFFLRLLEFRGASKINLELYHNTEILRGVGDFHFRCSDEQVIFRAGGHGNKYANSAIRITDTRVVHEYQQYFRSLVDSEHTRKLDYEQLKQLRNLVLAKNYSSIGSYLSALPRGTN